MGAGDKQSVVGCWFVKFVYEESITRPATLTLAFSGWHYFWSQRTTVGACTLRCSSVKGRAVVHVSSVMRVHFAALYFHLAAVLLGCAALVIIYVPIGSHQSSAQTLTSYATALVHLQHWGKGMRCLA